MSFGTRYETTIKDYKGNVLEVLIEKENYSGASTHISEGSELTIKVDGSRDTLYKPIKNSLLNFSFWVREDQSLAEYNELLESYYKQFRVSIYKNRSTLESLLDGQQHGSGVNWNLTGSTIPVVTLSSQDSKELTLDFSGAHIGLPYVFNYDFNVSMISGFASSTSPVNWTQIGSGTGFTRNSPWNNRWQVNMLAPGLSKELKGEIANAIPFADYTIYFPTAIANTMWSVPLINSTIFRMYATDDTVIDTVQKDYTGQGQKPETITFNGNAKTPGYFTIQYDFNTSFTNASEFWAYDSALSINPFGPPTPAGSISGETGSTSGHTIIRLLDGSFNVLQTEIIPWSAAGNYVGQVTLQSNTTLPEYVSIEGVHLSGDTSVIELNQFSLDGAINDHLFWRGWVKPEFLTGPYILPSFVLSLEATEALTDLKNLEVPISAATNNFLSSLQVVKEALNATGIPLPIRSQVNLNSDEFSGSTLANVFVTGNRFVDIKNGRTTYWTLEKALSEILHTYKATIRQETGYWFITQQNENNSYVYDYDYDTLVELNKQTRDRQITMQSIDGDNVDANPFVILGSDELSKVEPLRLLNVDLIDESSGANFIFNPSFETDLDGWSNSTGSTGFSNFLFRNDGDEYGGTLQIINQEFFANPNRDCYFESFPFNLVLTTGDSLNLSWDMNCFAVTTSGASTPNNPNYQVQILDATTHLPIVGFTDGFIYTGWRNYSARWIHTAYTGTCVMRVWVKTPPFYDLTLVDVRFDNFSLNVVYKNDKGFNRWFVAQDVNTTAIKKTNEDFYFSDSFVSTTKSALKYTVTGSTTESWHNADYSVTGMSIIELYQKEEFLQNAIFKDFVRLQVRSLETAIEIDSILNVTSKNKKYYIVSITKDLINNVYDLMIVQRLEDQEPNTVFSRGQYSNSGGGSGSGSGSGSGGSGGADPVIYYAGENITIVDNVINAVIPATQSIVFKTQSFTSTGTTAFSVTNGTIAVALIVDVNGLAQIRGIDYSIFGNNLNFGTAIPSGSIITVHYFETFPFGYSVESFTSTGIETTFDVASPIAQVAFIDINGAIQLSSDYSVTGLTTIDFGSPLPAGSTIQVHYFSS